MSLAPTPPLGLKLKSLQLSQALAAAGRQRAAAAKAEAICAALRNDHLRQGAHTEAAMGTEALVLLRALNSAVEASDQLAAQAIELFERHPFWPVFASFPGLRGLLGARILGEFGDDPARLTTPTALQALAGTRPVTKQSGSQLLVQRRTRFNRRLGQAVFLWSLPLRNASPAARTYYESRRAKGDRYGTAVRTLCNKYLAFLSVCLREGSTYDEERAAESLSQKDRTGTLPGVSG